MSCCFGKVVTNLKLQRHNSNKTKVFVYSMSRYNMRKSDLVLGAVIVILLFFRKYASQNCKMKISHKATTRLEKLLEICGYKYPYSFHEQKVFE